MNSSTDSSPEATGLETQQETAPQPLEMPRKDWTTTDCLQLVRAPIRFTRADWP
ncbi:hypothetical protein [Arthrobacter sp. C152]